MTVFAINGLGRIEKLAVKPLLEKSAQVAWINDAVWDPQMQAHPLEFDTVHGRWNAVFAFDESEVTKNGTGFPCVGAKTLSDLRLQDIHVVIDCTVAFKTEAEIAPCFTAVAKTLVVSAPVKDGPTDNIKYGVNSDVYDP